MIKSFLFWMSLLLSTAAAAAEQATDMQVDVHRNGNRYELTASFDTTLSRCAAYHYLTDYDAAKQLPGVVASSAVRESDDKVKVDRVADEQVLFFKIRMRSVVEYTERPLDGVDFTQLSGDSKIFRGNWVIEAKPEGSRLSFSATWEPDTVIPLFVIDHFAKNGLIDHFDAIASLAEKLKAVESGRCTVQELAKSEPSATTRVKGL